MLFPDAFSKEALILTCSPRSEFAVTLVTSRPEYEFVDLIANSILEAMMLSIAVKIQFCNPVFDCIDNIVHFPVNSFNKTPF